MSRFYEAQAQELVDKTAQELKKGGKLTPPEWAAYVKTGTHRERPPMREDWWYVRSASVLRKIAILGPVGVSKLRTKYGGRKRRGHKPSHFRKCSGNIIRKVLQQLEAAGYVKYQKNGVHKGRIITKEGLSFLDTTANTIIPKYEKKKATPKVEAKPVVETKAVEKKAETAPAKVEPKAVEVKKETPVAEVKKEAPAEKSE